MAGIRQWVLHLGRAPGPARWAWLLYWLFLFVMVHLPRPPRLYVPLVPTDKYLHFFAYFVLTLLGGRLLRIRFGAMPAHPPVCTGGPAADGENPKARYRRALLSWAVLYALYAVVDEWLQIFVHRDASFADWLANVCGVAAGTAVLMAAGLPVAEHRAPQAGGN